MCWLAMGSKNDAYHLEILCLRCITSNSDRAATAIIIPATTIKLKDDVGAVIVPKG
jgi:hypothetical protein